MNIAIFGGSFDPPHIGHEEIVNKSLEILTIDKLILIPTFLNPFKNRSYLSAKQRLYLLDNLFQNKKIRICDFEVRQKKQVATIDTIDHIKSTINPTKIHLVIGADNLETLHQWKNINRLKQLVTFVVFARNNLKLKHDTIQFETIKIDIDISSTSLRKNLNLKFIPHKIQQKVKEIWKIE